MFICRSSLFAVALVVSLALAGCAGVTASPTAEERQTLAPNGRLRVGVYPGSPTKRVIADLGKALAERLGVAFELVELKTRAELVTALSAGRIDFTGTNPSSPARVAQMDCTSTVLDIELGYLVVPGSRVSTVSNVDSAGVRVGVTQGSTSQITLPAMLRNATVVPVLTQKLAGEMLIDRNIDAFATNKAILFEMFDGISGSHILDGKWGTEHWAVCIPKGREEGLIYLHKFTEMARADGLVKSAAERAGLRGAMIP